MKESREDMQKFIKDFATKEHVIKAKICKLTGVSYPTLQKIIANDPSVSPRVMWTTYLMIKEIA